MSIDESQREFYLKPGESAQKEFVLLKRYEDENDPDKYSYEAWARRNEESDSPDCLVVYLSRRLDPASIKDGWETFRQLWTNPKKVEHQLKNQTIH